jgi:excisionase family DNA binding protein
VSGNSRRTFAKDNSGASCETPKLSTGVKLVVMESREVMNVRQASQYLGISPDTLYRYITEGEIPAFKLGNRWKLRKTILDRWMERKMSQAHARRR